MFAAWEKATNQFTKAWEETASRWWDETLREDSTLGAMGGALNGLSTVKSRTDRAIEDHWARWRLPSATDVERIHERLGELQAQLDRIEAALGQKKKAAKSA